MDTAEIRDIVKHATTETKFVVITRKYFIDILCGVSELQVRNCRVMEDDKRDIRVTLVYAHGVLIAFRYVTYSKHRHSCKVIYKEKRSWRDKN